MKNSDIPWIGEIPEKWKVVRTKNVLECGKEIVGAQSATTQLLSLTTKGIKQVEIGSTSGKVPDSYDTYQVVHPGNMVFCLFDLDCSAVFSGVSQYNGMISPAYKVTTLLNNHCPKFYGYWFDYIFDGRKYMFLSKNIRYSLTYDEFAALGIVAPPYTEQQAIADFLDKKCAEIDQMVALQEKFIEELKAYKQSLITETVTKGLNPNAPMKDSGVEWIGEIPEGWKDISLRQLFVIKAGGDAKPELYSDVCDVEHPYPVYTNTLDAKQVYAYTSMPLYCANSITVTGRGAVGHAIYREEPYDAIIRLLSLSPKMDVDCRYYAYYIDNVLHIFTNNAAIAQLSAEQLAPYHVLLPSKSEQQAIADYLDKKCAEIDQLIAIKQKKADELKEYKKSIIYEYVTGKRSVCE